MKSFRGRAFMAIGAAHIAIICDFYIYTFWMNNFWNTLVFSNFSTIRKHRNSCIAVSILSDYHCLCKV